VLFFCSGDADPYLKKLAEGLAEWPLLASCQKKNPVLNILLKIHNIQRIY
jgi:hypothetical protein